MIPPSDKLEQPPPDAGAPTVVVGAGLGGLSAAIHLRLHGRRVIVLEKNARVGGKLNLHTAEGYTFDTGPSLFTMPWIARDLFAAAGRNLDEYLCLEAVEPTCRYIWPDGTRFDAWQQLPALLAEVGRLEPGDVQGLLRFLAHTARIYDVVADRFLLHPFDGWGDLLTPHLLRNGWQIDSLRSVDAAVRSFFTSPYLRQVFNRYATYNGSSPYRSPATFNIIAYIELTEGGWYIRGGMYRLAEALLKLAGELGIEVRTGAEVTRIELEQGRASGVRLQHGEKLAAAQVVVNADPRYAYTHLLPRQQAMARHLARLQPSSSGFILFLGVNRDYEQLQHHNIFFSQDYPREFAAIFAQGVPAPDPTVYIAASCRSDPQHAPAGHMNLFVLVNAPPINQRVNWQREAPAYREVMLRKLERMGLDNLRQHIVYEHMWTPLDIQQHYYAAAGALYGPASNTPFAAFLRPPLRARGIADLYFVGGGTHPGGGIPLVLLSGRAVAQRIQQQEATRQPGG